MTEHISHIAVEERGPAYKDQSVGLVLFGVFTLLLGSSCR